jgi:hypothetical protein
MWKAMIRRCDPDNGGDEEMWAWAIAVAGVVVWGDSPEDLGMDESARLPKPTHKPPQAKPGEASGHVVSLSDRRRGA